MVTIDGFSIDKVRTTGKAGGKKKLGRASGQNGGNALMTLDLFEGSVVGTANQGQDSPHTR